MARESQDIINRRVRKNGGRLLDLLGSEEQVHAQQVQKGVSEVGPQRRNGVLFYRSQLFFIQHVILKTSFNQLIFELEGDNSGVRDNRKWRCPSVCSGGWGRSHVKVSEYNEGRCLHLSRSTLTTLSPVGRTVAVVQTPTRWWLWWWCDRKADPSHGQRAGDRELKYIQRATHNNVVVLTGWQLCELGWRKCHFLPQCPSSSNRVSVANSTPAVRWISVTRR